MTKDESPRNGAYPTDPTASTAHPPFANEYVVGDRVVGRILTDMHGDTLPLPDPDLLVHLQFRRFAGCPICNLHLRPVALRAEALAAVGVKEVIVFHSHADELIPNESDVPFPVIPDPNKKLYTE